MNKRETQMMLANLLSMYPNHTLNDYAAERWVQAMADIPAHFAYRTAEHWIDTEKWFPTVAHFRERVATANTALPDPDQAWEIVVQRIRDTYPGMPAPAWDTYPQIKEAVNETGKLRSIRMAEGDQVERKRRQFIGAYKRLRDAALTDGVSALADENRKALR